MRHLLIITCLLLSLSLSSQTFYISNGSNKIYKMEAPSLDVEFVLDLGFSYSIIFDLAAKNDTTLYAITDAEYLLKINPISGSVEVVNQLGPAIYTSLYYHPDDELYTINNESGKFVRINPETGTVIDSVAFNQFSPGDITYYKGNMIFSGADLNLYTYDVNSNNVPYAIGCTDASIFGLSNYTTGCGDELIYAFDGNANVYSFDPENITPTFLGNIFSETQNIYSATTVNETSAALCEQIPLTEVDCDNVNTEESFLKDFSIYPNPFNEQITIDFPEELNDFSISIVDIMGRKIYEGNLSHHIEMNDVEKGIYFIHLRDETGKILFVKKMVK